MNIKAFIVVLGLSAASLARADLIGVTDAALYANAVEQLSALYKQLETIQNSYTTATQQYQATQNILNKAQDQLNSLQSLSQKNSGHYGFGNLNNSVTDLKNQQWSANNWADALKGQAGSNQGTYRKLMDSYQKNHRTIESKEFEKGARGEVVQNYARTVEVNRAAGVQSEYVFNEINASLKRIHDLSQQIEKAENTKAAVDLNSRLLTEVAYLQTQNLKSQSLINQQLAQKQALELTERGAASQYLAFDDDY